MFGGGVSCIFPHLAEWAQSLPHCPTGSLPQTPRSFFRITNRMGSLWTDRILIESYHIVPAICMMAGTM
jgi:hypothetical protein